MISISSSSAARCRTSSRGTSRPASSPAWRKNDSKRHHPRAVTASAGSSTNRDASKSATHASDSTHGGVVSNLVIHIKPRSRYVSPEGCVPPPEGPESRGGRSTNARHRRRHASGAGASSPRVTAKSVVSMNASSVAAYPSDAGADVAASPRPHASVWNRSRAARRWSRRLTSRSSRRIHSRLLAADPAASTAIASPFRFFRTTRPLSARSPSPSRFATNAPGSEEAMDRNRRSDTASVSSPAPTPERARRAHASRDAHAAPVRS